MRGVALSRSRLRALSSFVGLFATVILAVLLSSGHGPAPLALASGKDTFTISGRIYRASGAAARCTGDTALLYPGVTRCLVYEITNVLDEPITVRQISMGLDRRYPAPPSGCGSDKLALPRFSGTLTVGPGRTATSRGLPITLQDAPTNQDDCQSTTLRFAYSGRASYAGGATLPATGAAVTPGILAAAAALLLAGVGLVVAARRPRDDQDEAVTA